ncbi:MAG: hypothetical protein HDT13_02950 [Butyrivibrio sp.]|nr:hypothetical protein [Butyrivibrio sp.]
MAIPIIFIGIAAVTGATGIGKTIKAGFVQNKAKNINTVSDELVKATAERLEYLRAECAEALQSLGEEKVFVLNGSIRDFLNRFEQIKNVDFQESTEFMEFGKLHIDQKEFTDLNVMTNFAASLSQGAVAGATGGALTAFGAYSGAMMFASASTGTAISTLSGAAATNATLAWFGGGSLAAGGMGMAGGTAVLGGLVAGPALLTMGIIVGAKAGKNLENAYVNEAKAKELCEEFDAGADQCIAIRRRTYMFYNLLARLDSYFVSLIFKMDGIIKNEGTDYSKYSIESRRVIAAAASLAVSVKAVLDTPILTEDGGVTEESKTVARSIEEVAEKMEKAF